MIHYDIYVNRRIFYFIFYKNYILEFILALNYLKRILSCISFIILHSHIIGQEIPPIEDFIPESYEVESQHWSISQADNKYIYAGNNKGLLEFNGKEWKVYPTPNGTVIRSVKVVEDKVYTGFYMNFGYWQKNDFGNLIYTSISDTIKDKLLADEQIWHILHHDDRVLFQSLNRIYIYNTRTEEINIISSELGVQGIFKVEDSIYYQSVKQGLFKIENGKPVLLNNLEFFKNDIIVEIAATDNGLLLITRNSGLYEFSEGNFQKIILTSADKLQNVSIFSALKLRNGNYALGTISNGLIYLSAKGEIVYDLNQNQGLSNNTVLSIFEDIDSNLWLGLDNGINCINITSPITIYPDFKGDIGTVYTSAVYNDYIYIGSNQGVFYKKLNQDEPYEFIEETNGQVWKLFVHDNTLFCGHNSGTFIINKDEVKLISEVPGGWNFKPIKGYPDILLQGTYTGLSVLEKKQDQWQFRNKVKGFDLSCRYMEFYDNALWVNHEYRGVYKLKLNNALTEVTSSSLNPVNKGKNSNIIKYDNELLYVHEDEVKIYDDAKKNFSADLTSSRFSKIKNDLQGKLIKDNHGSLWVFAPEYLGHIIESQFSDDLKIHKIPIPRSSRKEFYGFENINHIEEEKYLLGTVSGYINIDVRDVNYDEEKIILDRVQVRDKDAEFQTISLLEENLNLQPNLNTISFAFTIPQYDKYIVSEFQYTLEGFYKDWSEWSSESNVVFENLPPGDYTFKIRAKTGDVINSNELLYSFSIERPWYASTTVIIGYIIILIIIFLIVNKAYKEYYTKQKQKIVEENKKKLELKQLESERAIMKLNNEKLRQDIESKNRELASYTMSIIKKNELLNTIKKELEKSEKQQKGLKDVERVIDKNLNNKDDWKHFEEALNNLDKNFLKKLKAQHPELTPNDLRFCSFLRLNLSSKEIAPLLNISVRSVEIKRYRLRKKLNLDHSDNLVNYILEI